MSLLRRGTETVVVYPEELVPDADRNPRTRPSAVGVVTRAVVQPLSAPSEDDQGIGFLSESRYRLRLTGWTGDLLGPQSQVEWRGKRYSIVGEPQIYNGSAATAHVDYLIERR